VYERGEELVVVTWIRGMWTAVFCNGNLSVAKYGRRRGDVLQHLREHRPQVAQKKI
jgi:hypothetical protein